MLYLVVAIEERRFLVLVTLYTMSDKKESVPSVSWRVKDLRTHLTDHGLQISGSKDALVQR